MSVASLVRPAPRPQIDPSDIMTVAEAAELYRCSEDLIYKLVSNRRIRFYRIPGSRQLRFLRTELLEDFLATQGQE